MSSRAGRQRQARQRAVIFGLMAIALIGGTLAIFIAPSSSTTTTTTTSSTTTTTTLPAPLVDHDTDGWVALSTTTRGVAIDKRQIGEPGPAPVVVLRFRKDATAFHLHVGSTEPAGAASVVPLDAGPVISPAEWRVGVLGVIDGGQGGSVHADGLLIDGDAVAPLHIAVPALVVDANGQLSVGTWGIDEPAAGAQVVAASQGFGYLVFQSRPSPYVGDLSLWGPGGRAPVDQPRSAIGVNALGDVLYAESTSVTPAVLATALVNAGATVAIELGNPPEGPAGELAAQPLHALGPSVFVVPGTSRGQQLGSSRRADSFLVVLAQPRQGCDVRSPAPLAHRVLGEAPSIVCTSGS